MNALAVADKRTIYQRGLGERAPSSATHANPITSIVPDDAVSNVQGGAGGCINEDAFVRKSEDHAILNVHFFGRNNIHASNAIAGAVNG